MMRLLVVAPAAGAVFALSIASTMAAGQYDGTWLVEAPKAAGVANPTNPQGCDPVRLRIEVKNDRVTGELERAALGRQRVEAGSGSRATPLTGRIEPDGTVNAQWQDINVTGKLTGDTGELRWRSDCGQRVGTAKRISPQ